MKFLKSYFAFFLAVLMIFSLTACGAEEDTKVTIPFVTETATKATSATELLPASVTIGDCTIEYLRTEKYAPFENGESMLVYFKFTNNGTLETSAYKELYITAKCGDKRVVEMDYQSDYRPEGYNDYAQKVAPGESKEIFYILDFADGIVEVTIQDIYNQIPEKLVVNIDTSTLG